VDDVAHCVTMDLKAPGNLLYLVGLTHNELGGSHYALVEGLEGGRVPEVDAPLAKQTFAAMHRAIYAGHVRACHDLSEGGLAVAAAEMAFAGGCGAEIDLDAVPRSDDPGDGAGDAATLLFSESNTRFLCEVAPEHAAEFEATLSAAEIVKSSGSGGVPLARVGVVVAAPRLVIRHRGAAVVDSDIASLKEAWQKPLRW
jgi:phosphoribosylformylglycinamidine synthase